MAQSPAIRPLPPEVAAQLKSATAIPSLVGVVVELLKNALDAGASAMDVTVDHARGDCSAEDDGAGIAPLEFSEAGHLCKPYCSSKYGGGDGDSDSVLGCHGSFLAALAAVCLLTIASRHAAFRSNNALTILHSKVLHRQLATSATTTTTNNNNHVRGPHGTRVTVRNLFGNLPVRVKQRHLLAAHKAEHARQWEALKREVVAVLLPCTQPYSLSVRDSDHRVVFRFKSPPSSHPSPQHDLECPEPCASPRLSIPLGLLTQAGYILASDASSWVPASATTSMLVVKGAISLIPAPSKAVQFLSLGKRPLLLGEHNELYDHINSLFKLSSFGTADTGLHADGPKQHNVRKPADRYPMFYLQICRKDPVTLSDSTPALAPESNIFAYVLEVLELLTAQWLEAHHFRSRRPKRASLTEARAMNSYPPENTPRERLRVLTPDNRRTAGLGVWASLDPYDDDTERRSSGVRGQRVDVLGSNCLPNAQSHSVENGPLQIEPNLTGRIRIHGADSCLSQSQNEHQDAGALWMDPQTGKTYSINTRTGCVFPNHHHARKRVMVQSARPGSSSNPNNHVSPPISPAQLPVRTPWLGNLLECWDNPAFYNPEAAIKKVYRCGQENTPEQNTWPCCEDLGASSHLAKPSKVVSSTLSKDDLNNAEVVAQVDNKFILIKVSSLNTSDAIAAPPSSRLFLVDQHAADERIRVEKLLQQLCYPPPPEQETCWYESNLGHRAGTTSVLLEEPKRFAISPQECDLFITFAARFAVWGILFDVLNPSPLSANSIHRAAAPTLQVTHLPPSIAERCKTNLQILIDLLRSTAWAYSSNFGSTLEQNEPIGTSDWVRRLATIPPALIEMVNSRACRSAIMFNDTLSTAQCRSLVFNLSKCNFPFICAHGRPSLVPLATISAACSNEDSASTHHGKNMGFIEAWKMRNE